MKTTVTFEPSTLTHCWCDLPEIVQIVFIKRYMISLNVVLFSVHIGLKNKANVVNRYYNIEGDSPLSLSAQMTPV